MNQTNKNSNPQKEDLVFYVRVQYRCNSSWQGSIQWLDGKKSSVFRSVLELGNLINDARQARTGESEKQAVQKKWDEKDEVS